jgi:hypothetical protein
LFLSQRQRHCQSKGDLAERFVEGIFGAPERMTLGAAMSL